MRSPAPRTVPLSDFGLIMVREVAVYQRVSPWTVRQWIYDGRLPAVPAPRGHLIRRADCKRFVRPRAGRTPGAKKRPAGRPAAAIPLSAFGLMTVAEVAEYHGRQVHAVWCWVAKGLLGSKPKD